ncbi:sigma-70 family RNA polymerase sigma factor [Caldifermentibacillus hisashii]|uniref:sigma-70 family RNA polymerase sigma factor n=2 Tax=Caldifermentibacillus hisashii TaxID=996558 RepID=UPI002E1B1DF6|nr:sigma-70 family RNA polymerase sigma factor [Caldifermentibacillus hisashii]
MGKIEKNNNFNNRYCREQVGRFIKENKRFLEHKVVKSFLENEENKQLFLEVICYPTPENKQKLDDEFKKFFFNVRFTAFLSSILYFNSINYDKRHRKFKSRNQLTLDQPLEENEELSFKDLLSDPSSEINVDNILRSSDIKDFIVDPNLLKAIEKLTPKQKEVIDLAYVKGLSDTEIANLLGKSQQGISKLHKKALKNIYEYLKEGGEGSYDSS